MSARSSYDGSKVLKGLIRQYQGKRLSVFGVSTESVLKGDPGLEDLSVHYESGLIDSAHDADDVVFTDGEAGLEDPEQCLREVKVLMTALELDSYDRICPPEPWTHDELYRCAKCEDIKVGPMVSPLLKAVVGTKVLVYTATASPDEFESMSVAERSDRYFARACAIKGEAVNGERYNPDVCAVDLATGRKVSVVAECVFSKVEDALQMVSSADAFGRVAILVTESTLTQGQDTCTKFQGQTLVEALGLAGTAEQMRAKHSVSIQSYEEWTKAIERMKAEIARDCFGEAQISEHSELQRTKGVAQNRMALGAVHYIANDRNAARVSTSEFAEEIRFCARDVNGDTERQKRKGVLTGVTEECHVRIVWLHATFWWQMAEVL